jgi:predicted ATPase
MLSPSERFVFRRLGVFAGTAPLGAMEAVCRGRALDASVLGHLASLPGKNLVAPVVDDDEPRIGMLQTLRSYARELLADALELEPAARAHLGHYVALVEAAEPQLTGPDQRSWVERLRRDHDERTT